MLPCLSSSKCLLQLNETNAGDHGSSIDFAVAFVQLEKIYGNSDMQILGALKIKSTWFLRPNISNLCKVKMTTKSSAN